MIKQNSKIFENLTKIVEHLENNLDIDISFSTVHNFMESQGYRSRVARKKYFVNK